MGGGTNRNRIVDGYEDTCVVVDADVMGTVN